MRRPQGTLTVRRMMVAVAILALILGAADAVRMHRRAERYRELADSCDRMERRCREIDAMDPAARARAAVDSMDDPFLSDPAWNRKMMTQLTRAKALYRRAAADPRGPVPRVAFEP